MKYPDREYVGFRYSGGHPVYDGFNRNNHWPKDKPLPWKPWNSGESVLTIQMAELKRDRKSRKLESDAMSWKSFKPRTKY